MEGVVGRAEEPGTAPCRTQAGSAEPVVARRVAGQRAARAVARDALTRHCSGASLVDTRAGRWLLVSQRQPRLQE